MPRVLAAFTGFWPTVRPAAHAHQLGGERGNVGPPFACLPAVPTPHLSGRNERDGRERSLTLDNRGSTMGFP